MRVLMIVPAYNEAGNIKAVADSIIRYKPPEGVFLDYIVINDGSTDNTEEICVQNNIKHITLVQNLGIGGAVQTGYIYAEQNDFDVAVQFDGDGQHDINSLNALLAPIISGKSDFVVGSRFLEGTSSFKSTFVRRIGIRYLSGVIRVFSNARISDPTSGFRAANRKALCYLSVNYPGDYPEPESIVSLAARGFRLTEVQVNMFERKAGVSSISPAKSVYYMFKVSLAIICAGLLDRGEK